MAMFALLISCSEMVYIGQWYRWISYTPAPYSDYSQLYQSGKLKMIALISATRKGKKNLFTCQCSGLQVYNTFKIYFGPSFFIRKISRNLKNKAANKSQFKRTVWDFWKCTKKNKKNPKLPQIPTVPLLSQREADLQLMASGVHAWQERGGRERGRETKEGVKSYTQRAKQGVLRNRVLLPATLKDTRSDAQLNLAQPVVEME